MQTKKYWKSIRQYHNDPKLQKEIQNEFPQELNLDKFSLNPKLSRRSFLKLMMATFGATLAGCAKAPVMPAPAVNVRQAAELPSKIVTDALLR